MWGAIQGRVPKLNRVQPLTAIAANLPLDQRAVTGNSRLFADAQKFRANGSTRPQGISGISQSGHPCMQTLMLWKHPNGVRRQCQCVAEGVDLLAFLENTLR